MSAVYLVTTGGVASLRPEWLQNDPSDSRLKVRKGDRTSYLDRAVHRNGFAMDGLDRLIEFLPRNIRNGSGILVRLPDDSADFEGMSWHGAVLGAAMLCGVTMENRLPVVIVAAMTTDGELNGRLEHTARKAPYLDALGPHWLIAPSFALDELTVSNNDQRRIAITKDISSLFRALRLYLAATSGSARVVRHLLSGSTANALREAFGPDEANLLVRERREEWEAVVRSDTHLRPGDPGNQFNSWDVATLQSDPLMLNALQATIIHRPPPERTEPALLQIRPFHPNFPGCIVILIDQSGSMKDLVGEGPQTLRDACAHAVNLALDEVAQFCTRGGVVKPHLVVGVIGYGATVASAWGPKIQAWAKQKATLVPVKVMNDNQEGFEHNSVTIGGQVFPPHPVWIAPSPGDGDGFPTTPMGKAIALAGEWCAPWATEHRESAPPVIINITDGRPDGDSPHTETLAAAAAFKQIRTKCGGGLILTCHLSPRQDEESALLFPGSNDVARMTPECKLMFEISSDMPDWMVNKARDSMKSSAKVEPGCRGLVYNAPLTSLLALLRFASQGMGT